MSGAWQGGSTRAHRRARALVLSRDGGLCQLRLQGCTTVADQAHHVRGKAVTGDDPTFMVASCESCNLQVGDPSKHDPQPRGVTQW